MYLNFHTFVSDRMRLGKENYLKTLFSAISNCARLSLSLYKIGCGSATSSLKSKLLAWCCARLSLSLYKIGCGSATPSLKSKLLAWCCARLSLSLYLFIYINVWPKHLFFKIRKQLITHWAANWILLKLLQLASC